MKNFITFLVLPLAMIGFTSSALASDRVEHNTSISVSLNPVSNSYQIAKATFLPDRYDDLGLSNYDTLHDDYNSTNCDDYTQTSCPSVGRCERCPFNAKLYKVLACVAPYLLSDGDCVCPPAKPLVCTNDKCTKYCGSTCIEKTCTPTPSVDVNKCTNGTQKCDNGCCSNTRDCCKPCSHKITSKPENSHYITEKCVDDDGSHDINTAWECNSGYHEKNGACEKDCISNNCSGYPHSNPPSNATYSSCTITATNCSTDGVRYKVDSCNDGYKLSGDSCVLKTCEDDGLYSATACYNADGKNYGPLSYWTKANMGL